MADQVCNVQRLQNLGLDTYEKIVADPRYSRCAQDIYPLTGKIGTVRTTKKTLGQGTYGRVNLEEVEKQSLVATKYFTSDETLCENSTEIATLHYLKGLPNVAQIIRVAQKPAGAAGAPNLTFPAAIMGKAIATLNDRSIYKSWDDLYSIIKQVLKGYYTLHTQGIVHRDTKPANMLLTATKEVWITDFGMARYIDTNIPFPEDSYTGTYAYAAPELLLQDQLDIYESVDYFKSDAWAVGVSIYQMLTQQYLFNGANKDEIIDHIFRVKGTPESSDGDIYYLYTSYKSEKSYNYIYVKDPNALKWRIETRAVFKPADKAILAKVIEVVSGLLTYDPETRMSIQNALQLLDSVGPLPIPTPRKSLVPFYLKMGLPADISETMIDIAFDWVHEVIHYHKLDFSESTKVILLDRTGAYSMMFLNKYRTDPYAGRNNLQLIISVALHLASCFFDESGKMKFGINEIIDITAKSYTKPEVLACIKKYMLADMPFFGTSYLDSLLKLKPNPTTKEKETAALLNYICYQKYLFPASPSDLPKLTAVIIDFMTDREKFGVSTYITDEFRAGVKEKTKRTVVAFINAVKAKLSAPPQEVLAEAVAEDAVEANATTNANVVNMSTSLSLAEPPKPGFFVTVPATGLASEGGRRKKKQFKTRRYRKSKGSTRRPTKK